MKRQGWATAALGGRARNPIACETFIADRRAADGPRWHSEIADDERAVPAGSFRISAKTLLDEYKSRSCSGHFVFAFPYALLFSQVFLQKHANLRDMLRHWGSGARRTAEA